MQIKWQEDAINDLVALRRYIALDNSQAAQRVADKILECVRLLKEHPLLGKAGRIHSTRELVVTGTPFTIIYLPQPDSITILRVFHQMRQW
ncbi:MAG: type II toxin-antitoxin system RelE/ParE family toxin [Nitrosospira sp.]|nr:type II toxin-antitoxin system RelE/ParE family toxin [Nitrosospira sp.]